MERFDAFLKEIAVLLPRLNVNGQIQKILCVSHGGFIRNFINHYCREKLSTIRNCSISVIEVCWSLEGDFLSASAISLHHTDHLIS